ncbi:hypothetical protein SFC65_19745 [Priestia filamentosa]|uniref:hypothetical protein n=1 Tax=Priestia filamentosa TaxID=1402861 RepID=UPI003981AB2D
MSKQNSNIPYPYRDIVQKHFTSFIATRNSYPLTALDINTPRVKRMLDSDLSVVEGKRIDCLMELEDTSLLHIEFQSNYDEKIIEKCWYYDFLILTKYKEAFGNKKDFPQLRTVIVFTSNVEPRNSSLSMNFGTHTYNCEARFLKDYIDNEYVEDLLIEIKQNPNRILSSAEIVTIVYGTLAIQYIGKIGEKVYNIAQIVATLNDESTKTVLLSAIYTLTKNFLDDDTRKKLEEMMSMLNAFEDIEREKIEEGIEKTKLEND